MKTAPYVIRFLLFSTLTCALAACTTVNKPVKNHASNFDLSQLRKSESKSSSLVYSNPDSPVLSSYKSFIIDPVIVNESAPSIKKLKESTVADMKQHLYDSVIAELRAGGHRVVSTASEETLRISFTISDLKVPSALMNVSNFFIPVSASVGDVTVETVFRDSKSDQINTISVARAAGSRILNTSPWSTKSDIKAVFEKWAKSISEALSN